MSDNMEKYLWRFVADFGRSGSLDGLFVATEEDAKGLIGRDCYFGEALGKHSEVSGRLEDSDISKVDISPESVEEVSKVLGDTWSGWNPLYHTQSTCDECEDTLCDDEWNCSYREEHERTLCDECVEKLDKEEDIDEN